MASVRLRVGVAVGLAASLAALATTAQASRGIGTNVREGESIGGSGRVTFEDGGVFGFRRIVCDVTLNINANRSLVVKATGGVIGEVTAGAAAGCRDSVGNHASAIVLAEVRANGARHPFPMSYASFLGTLPEISGILVAMNRFAFLFEDPGLGFTTCLYEGGQGLLFALVRQTVTRGTFLEGETLSLIVGTGECPGVLRAISTQTFNRTINITLLP